MKLKISVVVTTYNRNELLEKALVSLVKQTISKNVFEIIVIDNSASGVAKSVVSEFKNKYKDVAIFYKNEARPGLSRAKNLGVQMAKADFVAFMDDDASADKKWLDELIKSVRKDVFIVGGPILPIYEGGKPNWFRDSYEIRGFGDKDKYLDGNEFFSGSNMAIDKNVLNKAGKFDANLGMRANKKSYGEETALQIEVVEKFGSEARLYNPKAIVKHLVAKRKMSLWHFVKTYWNTGLVHNRVFFKDKVGFTKAVIKSILAIFKIAGLLALIALRDKKKYKYWQNYLIEKVCPNIYELGVLGSFFEE